MRPAGQDHKLLLNKSAAKGQPNRATGVENKSLRKYPGVAPEFERRKPPSFEELKQSIDEDNQIGSTGWMATLEVFPSLGRDSACNYGRSMTTSMNTSQVRNGTTQIFGTNAHLWIALNRRTSLTPRSYESQTHMAISRRGRTGAQTRTAATSTSTSCRNRI